MKSVKAKTINGRPTSVAELKLGDKNTGNGSSKGLLLRVGNACNKINQVLAGMYTGVTCYGVPHEEHSYSEQGGDGSVDKKPDAGA